MKSSIAQNSKAHFNYEIVETLEVGMQLLGSEIKSIRLAPVSLSQAWILADQGELFIKGLSITPYKQASFNIPEPSRNRKLLAHKREIRSLQQSCERSGMTLIPLKLYFVKSRLKMLIGLCRGKTHSDKREAIKEKDVQRSMQRALKTHSINNK